MPMMPRLTRRALLGAAMGAAAATGGRAQAPFPDHPVRYIVPFPPGGLTDLMARLVGQRLNEAWGQPVVVDNRPGGNALIGTDFVAKSPPDGHTLLAMTLAQAVNVSLFPAAPYDFLHDFATISVLGSLPLVVCVNASSPARTLNDLAELARKRGLNGGSSGNGTPPHLGLELFRRASGAGDRIVHVPYRGGAPSITDLVSGTLDVIVSNLPECLPQIRSGKLRGLAVTSDHRHPLVPDIPTTREAGMPSVEITNWTAIALRAATPAPIKARIEASVLAAMRDPDLRRKAEENGFEVLAWDSERSASFVRAETERWGRLVAEAGIRAD